MSHLHVDLGAMATSANQVELAIERVTGTLNAMNADVDALFANWQGPAADKHIAMHQRFMTNATQILTALSQMHEGLLHTHQTYSTQESQQTVDHEGFAAGIEA